MESVAPPCSRRTLARMFKLLNIPGVRSVLSQQNAVAISSSDM